MLENTGQKTDEKHRHKTQTKHDPEKANNNSKTKLACVSQLL